MKRQDRDVMAKKTIAYYSGYNGIEIKDINDEYVICVSGVLGSEKIHRTHKLKVYNTQDDPYFILNGLKIPLSECMRTNA